MTVDFTNLLHLPHAMTISLTSFFSNHPQFIKSIETTCLISTSDHNVIVLRSDILNKPNVHHQSSRTRALYNFKKGKHSMINDYFSQVDWNALFQFCPKVYCYWKEFKYQTDLTIRMFVPKLTLSDRKHKSKYHYRISLINCSRQIPNSGEIGGTLVVSIEIFQICKHKVAYEISSFLGCSPDSGLTWNPLEIANTFNKYFSSVFTIGDGDNPCIHSRTFTEMPNIEFTPHIVFTTLQGLKSSMSSVPDVIPNIFLKKCASTLASPISHIFDASFKDQKLPPEWKIALVSPIHKKGPTISPENYRPISITATCCRVMEKIINKSLILHLTRKINFNQC